MRIRHGMKIADMGTSVFRFREAIVLRADVALWKRELMLLEPIFRSP